MIYLDNAATTRQKPQPVIDAVVSAMTTLGNSARGTHEGSLSASRMIYGTREKLATFFNCPRPDHVVFTANSTEALNMAICGLLDPGDHVIATDLEHNSVLRPLYRLEAERSVTLSFVPADRQGRIDYGEFERLIRPETRAIICTHASNLTGNAVDIGWVGAIAHAHGTKVLVDGAQSVPHRRVDVQDIDCDFLTFSGHKIYGPTGIGVLYGREELLEKMPPYQGGGEMIARVSFEKTTYERLPFKFEAGTPDFVGSHALAVALDYVRGIGQDIIAAHEADLTRYAMEQMSLIPGMKIYGTAREKDAVISFNVGDIHPLDLGTLLDRLGIAIRTGHHCAQPLMARCGVESMARASFALYNTRAEVDALVAGIDRVRKMF